MALTPTSRFLALGIADLALEVALFGLTARTQKHYVWTPQAGLSPMPRTTLLEKQEAETSSKHLPGTCQAL